MVKKSPKIKPFIMIFLFWTHKIIFILIALSQNKTSDVFLQRWNLGICSWRCWHSPCPNLIAIISPSSLPQAGIGAEFLHFPSGAWICKVKYLGFKNYCLGCWEMWGPFCYQGANTSLWCVDGLATPWGQPSQGAPASGLMRGRRRENAEQL